MLTNNLSATSGAGGPDGPQRALDGTPPSAMELALIDPKEQPAKSRTRGAPKGSPKPQRRADPLDQAFGGLVAAAVMLMVVCGALANGLRYLGSANAVDVGLMGSAGLVLVSIMIAQPRKMWDMALPIGLFMATVGASLRHEWIGTPVADIATKTAITLVCVAFFFAGASFRQRLPMAWAPRIIQICLAVWAALLALAVAVPGQARHNQLSGTMFELIALALSVRFAQTGKIEPKLAGAAIVAIALGGFLLDHRTMMLIGLFYGGSLAVMSAYRPRWLRLALPLVAIGVAIAAVVALTQLTETSQMAAINAQVTETTGRTMMSGRQNLWGPILDAIWRGPWVGYGPTKQASEITGLEFSAHNAFLSTGMNYGMIGVACTLAMIFVLMVRAAKTRVTSAGAMLSAFLMVVIIHNSSENALFMNNLPIATMIWLILGFLAASCHLVSSPDGSEKYLAR